jgi:hypothetical protein
MVKLEYNLGSALSLFDIRKDDTFLIIGFGGFIHLEITRKLFTIVKRYWTVDNEVIPFVPGDLDIAVRNLHIADLHYRSNLSQSEIGLLFDLSKSSIGKIIRSHQR